MQCSVMKAITTKEIRGACIPTITKGTEFEITCLGTPYSSCKGIPITSIYNDEFVFVDGTHKCDKEKE